MRVSGPNEEPISLEEAKVDRRLEHDTEDLRLEAVIASARRWCEDFQGRTYMRTTWRLLLDRFPPGSVPIRLPRPPLIAVDAVEMWDGAAWVEVAGVRVQDDGDMGRLHPDGDWPDVTPEEWAVRVTYDAGTDSPAEVPETARQAIYLLAGQWFSIREAVVPGMTVVAVPPNSVRSLLMSDRAWWP